MAKVKEEIIHFFKEQGFVIVSTIDKDGTPHNSCKGIVNIAKDGKFYLLDLYKGKTYHNLKRNPKLSLTVVNEHKFSGYCIKGKAELLPSNKLKSRTLKNWEDKITARVTKRVIKNLHEEKGHTFHPEVRLPKPKYMIIFTPQAVTDLTPQHLKASGKQK